jgi:class 3 adenylate cyclase/predicted ATPase
MGETVDIAGWLRELGLERYEQNFRESDVDTDILADLTDTDLEELGIPLTHRKKLLKAIAALECSGAVEPTTSHFEALHPGGLVKFQAERRQLTVLFCDLVDSTVAGLDPEDMGGVIHAYQQCCRSVFSRWDGHIVKYTGDRVLVYFGWPRADEGDAERAVRAGLELVGAVGRLTAHGVPLAARVGIATGLVMTGDLIGQGAAKEEVVLGETPNLAARVQVLAEPGTIVVADGTRDLVGGLFEYRDLGMQRLKGVAKPLRCWRVVAERATEGRFEALHGARLTPLVGREEEIHLLLRRWEQAVDGAGQVVLLSGEPGIGKSRVARGLLEVLLGEAHIRLRYQCSQFHSRSSLHPVLEQMTRAAGIEDTDPADLKLAKLEAILRLEAGQVEQAILLLAPLLSIPIGGRGPPPQLSAERRRDKIGEILLEQLAGLAASQPLLMIFEDAQWIDPSTSELLALAIERIHKLPVLLLVTFRSDFTPPWRGRNVTELSLAGLSRRQILAMVDWITGSKALPAEVLKRIVERTDGVPLFVEELTKTVLESGLLVAAGDHYELAGPLPPLAIPATLRESLMARLDRLGAMRQVAQIGAVIGREFSYGLLEAVVPSAGAELTATLNKLVVAELILQRGVPPQASYRFKHALVQEVAYRSLLKDHRQQLHAAVAQALEERVPGTRQEEPEVLAHHLTEAGLLEPAISYWHEAGRIAAERSAIKEAIHHLDRALSLLRRQPDARERRVRELALLNTLGPVLLAARGFADRTVEETYRRGRQLCQEVGDAAQLVTVLRGLWAFRLVRAELDASREVAMQLVAVAEREHSIAYELEAHRPLGQSLFYLGAFAAARHHCARTIALYDSEAHSGHVLRYGSDSRIVATSYEAWALWFLGQPDQSLMRGEEALTLAHELGHPFTLAQTLADSMYLYPLRGEIGRTREAAEATISCADEYGFPYWSSIATIHLGWALAMGEPGEAGLERMGAGLAAYRRTGATLALPWFLAMLAEGQRAAGHYEAAAQTLDDALAMVERTGERFYAAELHRLRGVFLTEEGVDEEAEAHLRRALSIAHEQQAHGWSLRTATSLARLWVERGRRAEARDLLAPVYGCFTEGFETADLKDAKALLEELA